MALIFGHSQVKYLKQYIDRDDIVCLSYSGYSIRDFTSMSPLFELIPSMSVVVIMAGANDIPKSSTAEVLTDLQQLCEKVHSTNPNATVVVCGILPRVQSNFNGGKVTQSFLRRFNTTATEVNNALRHVERQVPWMEFTEIPNFKTAEGINSIMLSRDGLHLSFSGTEHVAQHLKNTVEVIQKRRLNYEIITAVRRSRAIGPMLYSEIAATSPASSSASSTTTIPAAVPASTTTTTTVSSSSEILCNSPTSCKKSSNISLSSVEIKPAPDSIIASTPMKEKETLGNSPTSSNKSSNIPLSSVKKTSTAKKRKIISEQECLTKKRIKFDCKPEQLSTISEESFNVDDFSFLSDNVLQNNDLSHSDNVVDDNNLSLANAILEEELSISNNSFWKPEYNLKITDKELIENETGWLND